MMPNSLPSASALSSSSSSSTSLVEELSESLAQIEANLDSNNTNGSRAAAVAAASSTTASAATATTTSETASSVESSPTRRGSASGGSGGRSRWSSLGTALQDLRRSLSFGGGRSGAPAPGAAAAAASLGSNSNASPCTASNSRLSRLRERLSIAEMAHSTRTPLDVMQSAWRQQQQQQHPGPQAGSTVGSVAVKAAAATTTLTTTRTGTTSPPTSSPARSICSSTSHPPKRRRKSSSLFAARGDGSSTAATKQGEEGEEQEGNCKASNIVRSRRRNNVTKDDVEEEEIEESQLHRRLSTIRVLSDDEGDNNINDEASFMSTSDATDAAVVASSATAAAATEQQPNPQSTAKSNNDEEEEDAGQDVIDFDESVPETEILLSEDSSQKLDSSHRSVLFRQQSSSSSSISIGTPASGDASMMSSVVLEDPVDGGDDFHRPLPQVYSWGTVTTSLKTISTTDDSSVCCIPHLANSLYDTEESGDVNDLEPIGPSSRIGRIQVVMASTSCNHTAAVTSSGCLLTCGNNQYGAVDPTILSTSKQILKPTVLECITVPVLQVSCGLRHTAAVTATGTVLTWGSNDAGQLGHRRKNTTTCGVAGANLEGSCNIIRTPQILAMGQRRAASVACGNGCTLVLSTRMQVVVAGQLLPSSSHPTEAKNANACCELVPELFGLPIAQIAVGAHHAIVVTCHGTAFAWGDNSHGQCGQECPKELRVPVPMKMVPTDSLMVRHPSISSKHPQQHPNSTSSVTTSVPGGRRQPPLPPSSEWAITGAACGGQHSVLVTRSGKLWVCGDNSRGQLGFSPLPPPEQVPTATVTPAPIDVKFIAAVAGQFHTLALDTDQNVWQFGNTANTTTMQCVLKGRSILGIAAGGNHSIAISAIPTDSISIPPALPAPPSPSALTPISTSVAMEPFTRGSQLLVASEEATAPPNAAISLTNNVNSVGLIQHSVDDLVQVVGRSSGSSMTPSSLSETAVRELSNRAEELLRSPSVLNGLFLDPLELDVLYVKVLESAPDQASRQLIATSMERGMFQGLQSACGDGGLEASSSKNKDVGNAAARIKFSESVRFLLLYLQNPLFRCNNDHQDDKNSGIVFDRRGDLMLALCEAFLGLSYEGYRAMVSWLTTLYSSREVFVRCLVEPLLIQLERGLHPNAGPLRRLVPLVAAVLQWLYVTSERAGGIAKPDDFWSPAIAKLDPGRSFRDLKQWKRASREQRATHFFLCSHSFLFSPSTKRNLLAIENEMEMISTAVSEAGGVSYNAEERTISIKEPYYVLKVDRKKMFQETLQKVKLAKATDLRKKLKVVFVGEDGIDAGGVTREFFHLLSEDLFDVNSGYYLVGILVGLAVYNSVLLDVNFPPAVYRKLLALPLGLEDVVDQRLKKSFQQLLDYPDDDVEDVFCLTFSLSWMALGREKIIELKPGGSEIVVTSANKEEYVRLYVKWLLEESIYPQFESFERGFMQVMENSTLDFMSPFELELLVVGSPILDFDALEENASYEGFDDPQNSPVIRHLWAWLKNGTSKETRLQFLRFATGTSKAPIGGLGKLPFKIQKNGDKKQQLPTSHTCFNVLLLPDYGDDYDLVAERLGRAVLECEGFGLE